MTCYESWDSAGLKRYSAYELHGEGCHQATDIIDSTRDRGETKEQEGARDDPIGGVEEDQEAD